MESKESAYMNQLINGEPELNGCFNRADSCQRPWMQRAFILAVFMKVTLCLLLTWQLAESNREVEIP